MATVSGFSSMSGGRSDRTGRGASCAHAAASAQIARMEQKDCRGIRFAGSVSIPLLATRDWRPAIGELAGSRLAISDQ